jgi:hypothetical protein
VSVENAIDSLIAKYGEITIELEDTGRIAIHGDGDYFSGNDLRSACRMAISEPKRPDPKPTMVDLRELRRMLRCLHDVIESAERTITCWSNDHDPRRYSLNHGLVREDSP